MHLHIYALEYSSLSLSQSGLMEQRDMYSILYTTCHANLNEAPVHPASPFRMPSRVALSPCMVIGRDSPPGMPDCENPLGKKVSQPASQPVKHACFPTAYSTAISETSRVLHTACTAACASLLFFSPVHTCGVHGLHAFIGFVSLACRVDNPRIHDCTLSHIYHNLAFCSH